MQKIDAHIHLDHYTDHEAKCIIEDSPSIEALLSVSWDLQSCERNLQLARKYSKVKPAFGFHPEQELPSPSQLNELLAWITEHHKDMAAIGEVGLPYYLREEQKVSKRQYDEYIDMLETFIKAAKQWDKPIILHAVYNDAPIVCELLERYSVKKAHFHWFKGDEKTIARMMHNGYYISVTPDIVYETEIQQLVQTYPLEQIMVETDGPWPFEGPFKSKMTHPNMMEESIKMIAKIKSMLAEEVSKTVLNTTRLFYEID
jgi:TatD DNase family protein